MATSMRRRPRVEVIEKDHNNEQQQDDDEQQKQNDDPALATKIVCQLADADGNTISANIMIPVGSTPAQLQQLLRTVLLQQREERAKLRRENDDDDDDTDDDEAAWNTPHGFFLDDGRQILASVMESLHSIQKQQWLDKQISQGRRVKQGEGDKLPFVAPAEQMVKITAKPEASFRVRPVTRCAATLDGHSDAVLVVAFSPDGECLASGGGDNEVRIWDIATQTPIEVLESHRHWVQVLAWSPDGKFLASGSRDGGLRCWRHNKSYGDFKATTLAGHTNFLSHISWEPLHKNAQCTRFVSASKDMSLKVWRVNSGGGGALDFPLSGGHTMCVTCVKWGGQDLIYSSSQDRTVMVWSAHDGSQLAKWSGHAHWVNFVALNTDLCLRTGSFDHQSKKFDDVAEAVAYAEKRYDAVIDKCHGEKLVSCSDDNTMFLWGVSESSVASERANKLATNKPIARMTGHQGLIYHVAFSPDGTVIASCSNDKSVRLWRGDTGAFICTLRGHVAAVYHVSWSLDSRLLVSASRDTTLKLWSVAKRGLVEDMTGHADEIFASDWSPGGTHVATGSKDKKVRIWVH